MYFLKLRAIEKCHFIFHLKEKWLIYRNSEGNMTLFLSERDMEIISSLKRSGTENMPFKIDKRDFKI
ncbi:hypothetical protein DEA98_17105 [Brucella pseudogrignonensis]|nr:hypothetical protein [Brucella pseudogrignonensis]